MTLKPRTRRISSSASVAPPSALLESLAESRISVLYLARQAKEAKNNTLAKELTKKGQSLRTEIVRIRRTAAADWNKETKLLIARAGTAQSELFKLIENAKKSEKKLVILTRALGVVSNILSLTKKVL